MNVSALSQRQTLPFVAIISGINGVLIDVRPDMSWCNAMPDKK